MGQNPKGLLCHDFSKPFNSCAWPRKKYVASLRWFLQALHQKQNFPEMVERISVLILILILTRVRQSVLMALSSVSTNGALNNMKERFLMGFQEVKEGRKKWNKELSKIQ